MKYVIEISIHPELFIHPESSLTTHVFSRPVMSIWFYLGTLVITNKFHGFVLVTLYIRCVE